MRVALLGGTGCGGRATTTALRRAGHQVLTISRGRLARSDLVCDRDDLPTLSAGLRAFQPEIFIDHVAYTAPQVEGVLSALPASVRRYIFISSSIVCGPGRSVPYRSDEVCAPQGAFAVAKHDAEVAARRWGRGEVVSARLGGLYGPGHPPLTPWGRATDLAARLLDGQVLPVPRDSVGHLQPWLSSDHGAAMVTLCEASHPAGVVHLAGQELLTWPEALSVWAQAAGAPSPRCGEMDLAAFRATTAPGLQPFLSSLLNPPVLDVPKALRFTEASVGFRRVLEHL